jgi:hypothetical protein
MSTKKPVSSGGRQKKPKRGREWSGGVMPSGRSGKTRFVGVWRLVSLREAWDDGPAGDSSDFGPSPAGTIVYTASGHVSVSFMDPRRPRWASETDPTDADLAAAARGYSGYAGRYEVDEGERCVLHHVETALIPNRVGATLKRFYSFEGDRLVLRPPRFGRGGHAIERTLVWERAG